MKIQQTLTLKKYPPKLVVPILELFFEAQTRVNTAYLVANPDTPSLLAAGVRYRAEGRPERWKDIPAIRKDGHDDCEGLACWFAAELRVRQGIQGARVKLLRNKHARRKMHAVVVDVADAKQRWDPSAYLGMRTRRRHRGKAA